MHRRQAIERGSDRGFTLIELVTVVLIISVLAMVAIPFFLSQRTRSYEAQAQATLRDASTAMKSHATRFPGVYPGPGDEADLVPEGFRSTTGVPVEIVSGGENYCLQTDHVNLGENWHLESAQGKPLAGSCPP